MSSLDLRDLSQVVGDEVLHRMGQVSILLGLVRRDVSRSQVSFDEVWPEHHFWLTVEPTEYECNDLQTLTSLYVYPLVDALARFVDKTIVTQIVETLRAAKQIVPVSGARECEQWVKYYWQSQRTSTAGRCFLLSPKCETHVLRRFTSQPSESGPRMDACLSQKKHVFDLHDWWMLSELKKYVVAFQQQAITVTSVNLQPCQKWHKTQLNKKLDESLPDRCDFAQTLQYKDLCIQVTCTDLPKKKYGIRVDWVGSITRFNLNHCCLIAEEAFTA